ncbi:hypothetical protein NFI96_027633 [Prochilodus magdalenae]|nr:hypothetical protein NFI96_027633 [Prochilodus magdalenae]
MSLIGTGGSNIADYCCFNFTKEKIPLRRIKSYSHTRSDCALRAVVFHTLAGRSLCVDPETPWVKERMEKLNP